MPLNRPFQLRSRSVLFAVAMIVAACGSDATAPVTSADKLFFTTAQVASLDSAGRVMVNANPGNASLKSLLDSTLLVLTTGIEARRLAITTDLTTAPLYFVGVHRVVTHPTGSFSTWTLVGIDNPSQLANLVEVSGFAQSTTNTAPTSVSGSIGNGGIVNALMLRVAAGGAVTQWSANSGTVSFSSDAPSGPCPVPVTGNITCSIETMHVHFTVSAPTGTGGASARNASIPTDVDVPTMRLTFTGT